MNSMIYHINMHMKNKDLIIDKLREWLSQINYKTYQCLICRDVFNRSEKCQRCPECNENYCKTCYAGSHVKCAHCEATVCDPCETCDQCRATICNTHCRSDQCKSTVCPEEHIEFKDEIINSSP
jgi:hypothetical protein